MNSQEVTLTIPLSITVRIGDSPAASAPSERLVSESPLLEFEQEAARPRSYYQEYKGYDPDFLGTTVPLPVLTDEQRRNAAKNSDAAEGDDPTVLPYTHFSIVMNRRRQLAYYTVVNIDGNQSTDLERGRDRWYFDSRIAESEQIGEALYSRNKLDRGHLVRRLDPVWGSQARRANDDSFHFTNCSPQHAKFNQGQDLWQGLENYILDNADARNRKVTVFTGPVMDDQDPIYRGVRLPLAFWKIIAYVKADGTLATAAYMLEQEELVQDLVRFEAAFDPGIYRVELSHLKERTGLDFDYLIEHELSLSADGLEAGRTRVRIKNNYENLSL
ncbi:DNA/RNA non-specific endonuclease [Leptolyngbya sp. GB1-A1]|uniref:DNA/RNA non-specific endonuclease n=1 Tax=Leptolyngbya sp. GB1-A1 TaxID=2933908 RepID=UPI003297FB97